MYKHPPIQPYIPGQGRYQGNEETHEQVVADHPSESDSEYYLGDDGNDEISLSKRKLFTILEQAGMAFDEESLSIQVKSDSSGTVQRQIKDKLDRQ